MTQGRSNGTINTPAFFELLSTADQTQYRELQSGFSKPTAKNRQGEADTMFWDSIERIKEFVVRGEADQDKIRGKVCGICWFDDARATNTGQLIILMNRCKSSLNGSFHIMGWEPVSGSSELVTLFPEYQGRWNELRQWTVRRGKAQTPRPLPVHRHLPFTLRVGPSTPQPSAPLSGAAVFAPLDDPVGDEQFSFDDVDPEVGRQADPGTPPSPNSDWDRVVDPEYFTGLPRNAIH
jgi:hypothetical protein